MLQALQLSGHLLVLYMNKQVTHLYKLQAIPIYQFILLFEKTKVCKCVQAQLLRYTLSVCQLSNYHAPISKGIGIMEQISKLTT